jgi:hypothetical protein
MDFLRPRGAIVGKTPQFGSDHRNNSSDGTVGCLSLLGSGAAHGQDVPLAVESAAVGRQKSESCSGGSFVDVIQGAEDRTSGHFPGDRPMARDGGFQGWRRGSTASRHPYPTFIRRHSPARHVRKLVNQLVGLGYEVTLN